jgi:hypothetical protein
MEYTEEDEMVPRWMRDEREGYRMIHEEIRMLKHYCIVLWDNV